jgi:hypothetical protein
MLQTMPAEALRTCRPAVWSRLASRRENGSLSLGPRRPRVHARRASSENSVHGADSGERRSSVVGHVRRTLRFHGQDRAHRPHPGSSASGTGGPSSLGGAPTTTVGLGARAAQFRFLIRDRDGKFAADFDVVSPAPTSPSSVARSHASANAIAERFHRDAASEVPRPPSHHRTAPPRGSAQQVSRALQHAPPAPPAPIATSPQAPLPPPSGASLRPLQRDRLGGPGTEYAQVA